MGRERSRSRSVGSELARCMVADRAGTQPSITNWMTPNRNQRGGRGEIRGEEGDQGNDLEENKEDRDDDIMEEDISSESSSEVEPLSQEEGGGNARGGDRIRGRNTGKDNSTEGGEKQSEDEMSINSNYVDSNDQDNGGEERRAETEETVASALGLASAQVTPIVRGTVKSTGSSHKASFAGDTNFTQKKHPGSQVRRTQKVNNPYAKAPVATTTRAKVNEHDYHTYIRVQITLKGENDPPSAIQKILGNFLAVLQQKDPNACFTKELNVRKQIYEVEDFPSNFREFYDEWSYWEHDAGFFLPASPGGNGRSYHGTICLWSDWEGEKLLEQCVFSVRRIQFRGGRIKASVKELQVFRTSRNLILFGVPSNVDYAAVTNLLNDVMEVALGNMVEQDPVRYPEDQYQSPPEFSVVRSYVKNTPFEQRDKNDQTPSWAKLPLHLEVDVLLEDYLEEILKFMVSNKLINQVFGDYVWVLRNSPPN